MLRERRNQRKENISGFNQENYIYFLMFLSFYKSSLKSNARLSKSSALWEGANN